jgi:flagellar protein FlgJ
MSGAVMTPTDVLLGRQAATPASTAALAARKRQVQDAAQAFEASFLSTMLQPMFASLSTEAPFGGGRGEEMFRSFLTEAIAKQVARAGGIGVADTVQREMLKLQGLTE